MIAARTLLAAGLVEMDFAMYCALEAVSRSEVVELATSPKHYRWFKDHGSKVTPALSLGTAIHDAVLQPGLFKRRYMVAPEGDRRTKAGKAAFAEFEESVQPGQTILRASEHESCLAIQAAIRENPQASKLLYEIPGMNEVSAVVELDGTLRKLRMDRFCPTTGLGPIIVDLKSAVSAEPREWMRSAIKYRLHYQVAWYVDCARALGYDVDHTSFYFVVYEKTPPYGCSLHQFDSEAVEIAQKEIAQLLAILKKCEETGRWPDYSGLVHKISLPRWAKQGLGAEAQLLLDNPW